MRCHCAVAMLIAVLLAVWFSPGTAAPTGSGSSSGSSSSDDSDNLAGTWIAVEGEYQGEPADKEVVQRQKWTITATTLSRPSLNKVVEGKLIVNPKTSPRSFEVKGDEPIKGIYELKGDMLKVCFAATDRPTAFTTAGTSQDTLMFVFKREKK